MKSIKRLLIGLLSMCLIIGLPISIGRAEQAQTALTLTAGTQYSTSASENVKFLMTFSEPIAVPSGAKAHIGIYQGMGSTPYYYTWDSTTAECAEVSKTETDSCKTVAKWNLDRIRQAGNCTAYQLMADIRCDGTTTAFHWPDIITIYQKIVKTDSNVRLVVVFTDPTGTTPNGAIDAVANQEGTKKLSANATIDHVDWCQFEMFTDTISDVQLWDGSLFVTFARPINRTLGGASYTLGVYQNGTAIKTWNIPAKNLRYYGEDQTTICVDFASYNEVTEALAANAGAQVGLSVVSSQPGTDGTLSDVAMMDGYKLAANTTLNNTDAFYKTVSVHNEKKLSITDVVCYGTNQVLITFNKPIDFNTKHYAGLSVYNSKNGTAMMAYRIVDGIYEYQTIGSLRNQNINVDDGSSEWHRAQWDCSSALTLYSPDRRQFTVTVSGDAMDQLINIINDTDYDLRFRFQEHSGAGTANGMVDTVWSTADPSDKLLGSLHDDALDQSWCSVSRWMEGGAVLNGKFYADVNEALDDVVSGDTVVLHGYSYVDTVILPAGAILDLNGQTLAADTFIAFGHVVDSTDGNGGLLIDRDSKTSVIHLQQDNPSFPLFDAEVGSYRFFSYSLTAVGTKSSDVAQVKYGIKVIFNKIEAYQLLADDANADVDLYMSLTVDNNRVDFEFTHSIFNTLYQTVKNDDFANRSRYAITLTVYGLNNNGIQTVISAKPWLCSAHDVRQTGYDIAFEGEHDSYTRANAWIREQIEKNTLFSFEYNAKTYAQHISSWNKTVTTTPNGWTVTYTNGDVVAWSEISFDPETNSIEWTNYFKNNGTSTSPVISNIRALNSSFSIVDPVLTSANGSTAQATDFQPFSIDLTKTTTHTMQTDGGRSSQGAFPYFDIGNGEYGIMGAIGWTGNWSANFKNNNGNVAIDAGMQNTNIALYAGEQMRTPMIMIQFFKGDQDAGHNALRRLMLKSYTPSDTSGKPIEHAMLSVGVVNTAGQGEDAVLAVAKMLESSGIAYECLWIDAGWFGDKSGDANLSDGTWSKQVGNWYFIEDVYPEGMQNLRQYLEEQNKGLVLWFEPERVAYGTQLAQDQYILRKRSASLDALAALTGNTPMFLYNFADDDACNYMIDTISGMIQENHVTWYRQDFNIEPESYWSYNENSNRKGMTEIKYITNLYRYLDALVEQNPGLMIDNCAAGGRRLDLEMMRRSIPLWNSDYATKKPDEDGNGGSTPDGIRANNYNLSWWLPIHAGGWPNYNSENTTYAFRVDMNSGMQLDAGRATNATVQKLTQQYFTCRELMNGDYYILAAGKDAAIETADACYEFYKPKEGKGYIVAFCPEECTTTSATYHLKGLDANATYELEWVDSGQKQTFTGRQLMENGLPITYAKANQSLLIYITKK